MEAKLDIQKHLDESHKYMCILVGDMLKRLDFLRQQIDERETNLKDCEEAIKHVPSTPLQLRIKDLRLKFFQTREMVQELIQVVPKIKFFDLKYNALILDLDAHVQNKDSSSITPDKEENCAPNVTDDEQMQFETINEHDNLSTTSSSHSKNLDLEEIKQNSIMLTDMSWKKKHSHFDKLKKKKKKDLKLEQKLFSKIDSKNHQTKVIVNSEKSKLDKREEKKDKRMHVVDPQPIEDKILIRSKTRICPEPDCKKHFNSAPSIKYHLVSMHPAECHKYKLGEQYLKVANQRLNQKTSDSKN